MRRSIPRCWRRFAVPMYVERVISICVGAFALPKLAFSMDGRR